jgi:hypothetical protein
MGVTKVVTVVHGDRGRGRIVFRADDERLTPHAGLACVGELARRTGLVELIDAELATEGRAAPVKRRRRGVSGGELVVSLAESQLVGGECFDHLEELRADEAGAPFRAVAGCRRRRPLCSWSSAFGAVCARPSSAAWRAPASGWTARSDAIPATR